MKSLVIFAYFERGFSKKNLSFFIKKGLIKSKNIDFLFIINGPKLSIAIPNYSNVYVQFRENRGGDFAAWAYGLSTVRYNDYDYFIFLNDTVRGPFLPRYISNRIPWPDLFCSPMIDNNQIKLVGTTKNYMLWGKKDDAPHIQSMTFATDRTGLDLLIASKIFLLENQDDYEIELKKFRKSYIVKYEVGLSKCILNARYLCYAHYLADSKTSAHGDIYYEKEYFKSTVNPLEVMFIKTNRIDNNIVKNYTSWLS